MKETTMDAPENQYVAASNADKEIWRRIAGDFYSPNIAVTKDGNITICVGGLCITKPIEEWHAAKTPTPVVVDTIKLTEEQIADLRKPGALIPKTATDARLRETLVKCRKFLVGVGCDGQEFLDEMDGREALLKEVVSALTATPAEAAPRGETTNA